MVKPGILALLRASKKSTVLDTPINAGVSNSDAWPIKEHESLKGALRNDKFFTDLMLTLRMTQIQVRRDINDIDVSERDSFLTKHENAMSHKMGGTTTNKGSLFNFEVRLKRVKILVVQHVQDCMSELRLATRRDKTLFTSDQVNSGAVSHDAVLRSDMQLHTLVNDILAKNLLAPGPEESTQIVRIVCKENILALKLNKLKPEEQKSVAGETVLYVKALAKMREYFT
jgi:hypothetical protein